MGTTFSVLLPTRNGGKYLNSCIRSILNQQDENVQLIISDNANTDETLAVLDVYRGSPSVRILRTEQVVSVTDNWNIALAAAQGDYVLMMGDDDYLLPGYFNTIRSILSRHASPDCVLYNGYSFVAPASIADNQTSYYSESHFHYGEDFTEEHELTHDECRSVVRDMFSYRVRIPLNMQTTLVRRQATHLVPGGGFSNHHSPITLLLTHYF